MKKPSFPAFLCLLAAEILWSFTLSGQWTPQVSGFKKPNQLPFTTCAVNEQVVWAASVDAVETFKAASAEYTRTLNGGRTWISGKITSLPNLRSACITAVDANTAWVAMNDVTKGPNGGIYKTSDGGKNWKKQSSAFPGTGAYIAFVHFFDMHHGIAMGRPRGSQNFEGYTSTDGGNHWNPIPPERMPVPYSGDIVFDRCFSVRANTIWFGTGMGRVYKSNDRGMNWTSVMAASDTAYAFIHSLAFKDDRHGLVTLYGANYLRSTQDGGKSWESVPVPTRPSAAYICFVPGTRGAYVITAPSGFGFSSGSAYTTDNGHTWAIVDTLPHQRATFLSPVTGWSGGINKDSVSGGFFKWSGDALLPRSYRNK